MNSKEFMMALDAIVKEKNIDKSIVLEAMELALAAAYKKNEGLSNVRVSVNGETGEIKVYSFRTVVEEVTDEILEISLEDARKIVPNIELEETIEEEVIPKDFGRVAAATAKQVVVQKIKEAEKNSIMEEFKDKQDELVVGILTREDENNYFVDLGRICGILPKTEIIPGEKLVMESSVKAYISKLELGTKGQLILLSRTHYGFLKRLLELEIPELNDGTIMLYSVARDAGSRSKISVYTDSINVDPVGAIIGGKGSRINRISNELNGEKIDVILYDKDPVKFIQNALSPAKNVEVVIKDAKKQEAIAIVDNDNLSLAIGKKGQNVKLAARLTHYKIDVKTKEQAKEEKFNLGDKMKKIPMRTCVVTREKLPKRELLRIVKNNNDEVFVDETGKQNGRGVYIKKDLEVLEKAKKSKILDRQLEIAIDDRIYEEVRNIIENTEK